MRRAPFLVALILAAACASTTAPAARTGNADFVRSIYEAFGRGDAPTVLAAFSPDIVWTEAESLAYADRNPYRGPDAVAAGVFGRLMTEWANFQVRPETFIDGGDKIVVLGRYAGTYKATNRPVNAQFVHVWTVDGDKVTRFEQFTDTDQFSRAMRQ